MDMWHSEILASLNSDKNFNLVPCIQEQPYFIVIPAVFQFNYIYQCCWKNASHTFQCLVVFQSRGKVLILDESRGQICHMVFFVPFPLDFRKMINSNLRMSIARTTFQSMVLLQSRGHDGFLYFEIDI